MRESSRHNESLCGKSDCDGERMEKNQLFNKIQLSSMFQHNCLGFIV